MVRTWSRLSNVVLRLHNDYVIPIQRVFILPRAFFPRHIKNSNMAEQLVTSLTDLVKSVVNNNNNHDNNINNVDNENELKRLFPSIRGEASQQATTSSGSKLGFHQ